MGAGLSLLAGALIASALWGGRTVHAGEETQSPESANYASPLEVLLSPDGARLYVLCQESEEIRVLNAASYAVIGKVAVGRVPRGFSLSPDGARLIVTNSWDDALSVIDTATLTVTATWPVGAKPSSVVEDREGKRLFVANRISGDVAVLDGDRIWAGTDNGLALYENHTWKTYTTKDGLAHRAVLSLALDRRAGDVWAGTMGGLSRISSGRIDSFTQLNSGLSNDVVYSVSIEGENV
jgi:YVTN family beta-propeller protein